MSTRATTDPLKLPRLLPRRRSNAPLSRYHTKHGITSQSGLLRNPPPPLVVPHPLSFPKGGVGDRHLVNPKFFVAAHCVVVWVTVLWGTATCIPCTHGGTFCLLSLKGNLTAQPCFSLGQM